MDGCIGRLIGWLDGWMISWMDRWIEGWMEWMNRKIDWMDEWMDESMDGWMKGGGMDGWLDGWMKSAHSKRTRRFALFKLLAAKPDCAILLKRGKLCNQQRRRSLLPLSPNVSFFPN